MKIFVTILVCLTIFFGWYFGIRETKSVEHIPSQEYERYVKIINSVNDWEIDEEPDGFIIKSKKIDLRFKFCHVCIVLKDFYILVNNYNETKNYQRLNLSGEDITNFRNLLRKTYNDTKDGEAKKLIDKALKTIENKQEENK